MVGSSAYEKLNTSSDELLSPDSDDTKLGSSSGSDKSTSCANCACHSTAHSNAHGDRLLAAALLLAFVSLVLSIWSSVKFDPNRPRTDPYTSVGTEHTVLPRPNMYIGLERVQYPANASDIFKPFKNWPLTAFQMNAGDAKGSRKLLPEQDRKHFTKEGMVVPEDHRIVVDKKTSTIIQFRALDWGMENCVLHLDIPALPVPPHAYGKRDMAHHHAGGAEETDLEHENEEPHSLKDGETPPSNSIFKQAMMYANASIHTGSTIDIYYLGADTGREFLPNLWWGTAQPRERQIKQRVVITPGVSSGSYPFSCAQGSFPTFEFVCADYAGMEGSGSKSNDACSLDWWQDADRGVGFHLTQHWSRG
ncbi:hypothetical protein BKA62DRAFT_717237 [Auriculariales sp. MPI-PUGE-AT-0066]|nr:hypothetical protein BKA62DRAFT_717237 [Auriculariales sp. MPI-PUGE-AT-0066]